MSLQGDDLETEGFEFEIEKFEVVRDRKVVALVILSMCGLFLMGAAIHGLLNDDFSGLEVVFNSMQTLLGAIVGYYFGSK